MVDVVADVLEFTEKFQMGAPEAPALPTPSRLIHRLGLMQEEALEFEGHVHGLLIEDSIEDREGLLDAIVDIVYVAVGTAIQCGFDFDEAWRRVHSANMAKELAGSRDNKRQEKTDVIKPAGWRSPVLTDLVTPKDVLCEINGSTSVLRSLLEQMAASMPAIERSSEA